MINCLTEVGKNILHLLDLSTFNPGSDLSIHQLKEKTYKVYIREMRKHQFRVSSKYIPTFRHRPLATACQIWLFVAKTCKERERTRRRGVELVQNSGEAPNVDTRQPTPPLRGLNGRACSAAGWRLQQQRSSTTSTYLSCISIHPSPMPAAPSSSFNQRSSPSSPEPRLQAASPTR